MNFLRLFDPLLSILFEDDDILAINKPYGFNAHTNDSKIEHSEFIQDGLIEIYEKNFKRKLHIIHRLDQTTTGVMIFGKSPEAAKKYAEYFFERKVQKTYQFITKTVPSAKPKQTEFKITDVIIHKGKELDAVTDFKFVKKNSEYELWQAEPHTGRNHQIRIHAKSAGISILGDPKYEGAEFQFLCLHNCQIEFPNGLVIKSKPPAYFDDLNLLKDSHQVKIAFDIDRRQRMFSKADKDQCFRLVHSKNKDKNKDLIIDRLGQVQIQQNPNVEQTDIPSTWIAYENKIKFELHTDLKNNSGLFTNQRLQRNWVLENSAGKSVLNLFSHTGGYSVCAAIGKASSVTSVDLNKNSLNWSRKNFEINGVDQEPHKFLLRDSLTYIQQCLSKNIKFDLITCDAPTFYRREKGIFKIEDQIGSLIECCLLCLNINGNILFSTTADDLYIDEIKSVILSALTKSKLQTMKISCILPSLDFELPDEKPYLKSFLIY